MDMERTRFALKKALHPLKNFECYMDGSATPYKIVVVSDKFRNTDATARVARVTKMFKEGAAEYYNAGSFSIECMTHGEWDKAPDAKKQKFLSPTANNNNNNANTGNGFKKAA